MKKIMGHLTGKLSLSILSVIVLLVGVLAGVNGITSTKAAGKRAAATSSSSNRLASASESLPAAKHNASARTTVASHPARTPKKPDLGDVKTAVAKMPMIFEPNRGQTDSRVKYVARGAGYTVFLTGPSSAVMAFHPVKPEAKADRLTMNLAGANGSAQAHAEEPTGGVSNYYIGNDRSKWLEGVQDYAKVRYSEVYRGIDVVYQGDNSHFRYDFVVKPGADPQAIRMSYQGANSLRLNEKGEVVAALNNGDLVGSKPYIYQEIAGTRRVVDGGYVLTAKNDVQFTVGSYDKTQPLIIDPGNSYVTYFISAATSGITEITSVAMDPTCVYFTGWTNSLAYDTSLATNTEDAVIGKFDLLLHTATGNSFFGGVEGNERGLGVAVQGSTLVAVGWTTSGIDFPTAAASKSGLLKVTNELNSNRHVFVATFSTSAGSISNSVVLAGLGAEQANAVAMDNKGNIHITGATSSSDFLGNIKNLPATSAQTLLNAPFTQNAFYAELPSTLASVSYASFLGGSGNANAGAGDSGNAIATDASGNAYIAGTSNSWGATIPFPVQPPQPCVNGSTIGCLPVTYPPSAPLVLKTFSSGTHAFVAAFNPNATNNPGNPTTSASPSLLYSIPIGGDINTSEIDYATAITVDDDNNVYVGGAVQDPSQVQGTCTSDDTNTCSAATNGSISNNNVVFTAPGIVTPNGAPGSAAGPGVVAAVNITSGGGGYSIGDSVSFSAPQLNGGQTASGHVSATTGSPYNAATAILIDNQGSGYIAPPTVTIGNGSASGTAIVGTVIMGNPTTGGQDGWVVELIAPGGLTTTFNGGYLFPPNTTPTTPYGLAVDAPFPGFVYGTLVNGDEAKGNGTGVASPAGGFYQVFGLVSDSGAVPQPVTTGGNPGYLENIYVTGGGCPTDLYGRCNEPPIYPPGPPAITTDYSIGTGGSLRAATDFILIRRRIDSSGFDQIDNPTPPNSLTTETPFTKTFPTQSGVITPLGDYDLGPLPPTTTPSTVNVTNTTTGSPGPPTLTAATVNGVSGYSVTVTTQNQVTPATSCTTTPCHITVSNISVSNIALSAENPASGVLFYPGQAVLTLANPIPAPFLPNQTITISGTTDDGLYAGTWQVVSSTTTTVTVEITATSSVFGATGGNITGTNVSYNGTFSTLAPATLTGATTTTDTYFVPGFPGVFSTATTGTVALPARSVSAGTPPVGVGTGVAYDLSSGTSCIGGILQGALLSGVINKTPNPTPVAATYPGGTQDGMVGCAVFHNDAVLNGQTDTQPSGAFGTNGSVIQFTMTAGVTQTTQTTPLYPGGPNIVALSASNLNNQVLLSLTNPNMAVEPFVIPNPGTPGGITYTPSADLAGFAGPASASNQSGNQWLHVSAVPGGSGIAVSLLDQTQLNNPSFINAVSLLDPGYYTATFYVVPLAGDNVNVPIQVTVKLVVTGTVEVNSNFGGGVSANVNVSLNEGGGFVGGGGTNINIPILSAVPLNSPSRADIVFDLKRDINNEPVYVNSNPDYPVLGPASRFGNVTGITITQAGSGYTPNTTVPLIFTSAPAGGTTAAGTVVVDMFGNIGTNAVVQITTQGSGYSNPPFVMFPLPTAGGTQATATATLGGALNSTAGGVVDLTPTNDAVVAAGLPGEISCGSTPNDPATNPTYPTDEPGPALTNNLACYIQVQFPPNMLAGAPPGTYTGSFTLLIPAGTLNSPPRTSGEITHGAWETSPPSPSTVVTFVPSTPFTVTITVTVGTGNLILNSPWISNVAPFETSPPVLGQPCGTATSSSSSSGSSPSSGDPEICLAPFSVPTGYNGTVTSSNNGIPYIVGITGNAGPAPHNLSLDSRNLLLTSAGSFTTTLTPGIDQNFQLAYTETLANVDTPPLSCIGEGSCTAIPLPVATCTVNSPPIPTTPPVLQYTMNGILPASNAPSGTTTDVSISIVNPSSLAPGFYASTITYAALNSAGAPVMTTINGVSVPAQVVLPVCLAVGNNLDYLYATDFNGNIVASGTPPAETPTGGLYVEAGFTGFVLGENVWGEVLALGPSQDPQLPVPGGAQFAPPDDTLSVPITLSVPASEPSWIFPAPLPNTGGIQSGPPGSTCEGTMPVGSCTPAWLELTVAPEQGTTAGEYFGGLTATSTGTGLFAVNPNPLAAILPVLVSSGPAVTFWTASSQGIPFQGVPATVNGGGVFEVDLNGNGGSLYSAPPLVHFQGGGCTTEPTGTAVLVGGSVNNIVMNTVGAGCSSAPVVTVDPPTTPGGTQACLPVGSCTADVSNATIMLSFTEPVGAANTIPSSETIFALPSRFGIDVHRGHLMFGSSATASLWLADSVDTMNCHPATFNPTQAEPGFFNGCLITFTPNLLVQTLPPGTYYAWEVLTLSGSYPAPQPTTVLALVTLTVGNVPAITSTLPAAGAAFTAFANGTTTSPNSVTTNLGLSAAPNSGGAICATQPAQPSCTVPFTATISQSNGPPSWLFINGGTAPVSGNLQGPNGTGVPLTISINTATLAGLTNLPVTWNGTVTITTFGTTSNSPLQIPVSITISQGSSLSFSPAGPFSTSFTPGQTNTTQTGNAFSTTLQQFGTTGNVTFTSTCASTTPCPWITLSTTSSTLGLIPLTITITPANLPTTVGTASATITATGPGSTTSATVNVAIGPVPITINLPALTCTPANPVTAGTASVTCTSSAALSVAPANPTTLPATVTASIASGGPCTVTPASSTITLSTTATPLSFTVSPAIGVGLSGTCTLNVGVATTSGITPAITASGSATITVQGAILTATPSSLIFNLPLGAAPATMNETVQATSTGGNTVAVPFTCAASVSVPAGGTWLACTPGTTTSAPPAATSTVTATAASLPVGTYGGSVAYSSTQPGVTSQPPNNPVTLYVGALSVTGGPVTFNHQLGVTVPVTATLNVSAGVAAIVWNSTTAGDCAWLGDSLTTAMTPGIAGGSNAVVLSYTAAAAAAAGVANSPHVCTITFSPAASYGAPATDNVTVTATLNVSTNPVFQVTPNAPQTESVLLGATTAPSITFQVAASSILAPATSITATVTPFSNNPFNGAASPTPIFTAPATITVTTTPSPLVITVSPTGLPQGTYQGSFTIADPSATPNTAVVTVNLVVVPQCLFTLSPSGPVNLTNAVPANGSTPVSVPGAFTVTPNAGCTSTANTWTASVSYPVATPVVSWLVITSGGSGNGGAVGSGTFNALSNPTSSNRTGTITLTPSSGVPSVLQVTQPGSTAPLLDRQVTALYQSVLGRDPDSGGYAFWTGAGTAGLGQMLDGFTTSPEAFNTDFAVMSAWQAATGAPPTYAEFTASVSSIRLQGALTGIPALFTSLYTGNNSGYTVTTLYQNLLNRAPTAADASCTSMTLVGCFETLIGFPATTTPAAATNNEFQSTGTFANHTSAVGDHTNGLYVRMLYYTILGRDADQSGLTFWLGIANSGGAGLLFQGAAGYPTRIQILGTGVQNQGFAGSAEFQSLYQ